MFYEGGNKILTMLEQKRIPLGIQCFTGSTALVEVMGATGFDFVMFDAEHSGNDARAMEELVRTATFAGMASYIRVLRSATTPPTCERGICLSMRSAAQRMPRPVRLALMQRARE